MEVLVFDILVTVLPVFLVVSAGYAAVRGGVFKATFADGLMAFCLKFAIPSLLFRAVSTLDLAATFSPPLLLSFYTASTICFALSVIGARVVFKRDALDAIVIGFAALFSNCFLLGIPIMERAFGADALAPNFAIIAIHSPYCYLVGITAMEVTRAGGRIRPSTGQAVLKSMFGNPLMIGLGLGFIVNLGGIDVPDAISAAVNMMADAALPAALFGMGGVLTQYQLRRSIGAASMVAGLSLILHPLLALIFGTQIFDLPRDFLNSAVVTAAMPTGANAFIFATLYGRATGAAASAVLLATALSPITAGFWLYLLKSVLAP